MDLGALNAYLPSLLRENEMLEIPGEQAPYQVKPGDTLASIAAAPDRARPVSPMAILAANFLTPGIFAGGAVLSIPPTRRRAEPGDTLESVAMRENVSVSVVAANNAETAGFFADGQQLSITRGTIKVETLIDALLEETAPDGTKQPSQFLNLSGMTSRFMLPGIRLPKPKYLAEDVRSLWPNAEPAPLYAMTGQQFALPKFALPQMPPPAGQQAGIPAVKIDPKYIRFDIDLKLPERGDIASWYEFAGGEEATMVTVPLYGEQPGTGGSELLWIEQIRGERLQPSSRGA
jgi:LysM repeat protein